MPEPDAPLEWTVVRAARVLIPEHVVYRALAHETVLLNIHTSTYHAVDETGARFLEVLEHSDSLDHARQVLVAEYEQPADRIAQDMMTFLEELWTRGLIEIEPAPSG